MRAAATILLGASLASLDCNGTSAFTCALSETSTRLRHLGRATRKSYSYPWKSEVPGPHSHHSQRQMKHDYNEYNTHSQSIPNALPEDLSIDNTPEYWLDLRGISVSPKEAIRLLNTFLENNNNIEMQDESTTKPALVDRVLMDESDFTERVKTSSDIQGVSSILLYSTDPTGASSISILQDSLSQYTPFATVLNAEPDRNMDAMLAMDTVLQKRQWVFVETKPGYLQDSVEWMSKQVTALYDLLATSYGSGSANEVGVGLILPMLAVAGTDVESINVVGGMAVAVPTASTLIDIDFTLMRMSLARQMKSSTDSDILLPNGNQRPNLQTALVIPFDLELWRLLLDLKQN
jgi:hypothetical protein